MVSRLLPNRTSNSAHIVKWLTVNGLIGGPPGKYSSSASPTILT